MPDGDQSRCRKLSVSLLQPKEPSSQLPYEDPKKQGLQLGSSRAKNIETQNGNWRGKGGEIWHTSPLVCFASVGAGETDIRTSPACVFPGRNTINSLAWARHTTATKSLLLWLHFLYSPEVIYRSFRGTWALGFASSRTRWIGGWLTTHGGSSIVLLLLKPGFLCVSLAGRIIKIVTV